MDPRAIAAMRFLAEAARAWRDNRGTHCEKAYADELSKAVATYERSQCKLCNGSERVRWRDAPWACPACCPETYTEAGMDPVAHSRKMREG